MQGGKRDFVFTGKCFVVIIPWFNTNCYDAGHN